MPEFKKIIIFLKKSIHMFYFFLSSHDFHTSSIFFPISYFLLNPIKFILCARPSPLCTNYFACLQLTGSHTMVKFSKRVIILSAFVVAVLDGRRLKNNKNSKNNKIKPCDKNKNKPEQEVVGSVGREVEIVHEIQKSSRNLNLDS